MRGLVHPLSLSEPPIRINTLAPDWTDSQIVSREVLESIGATVQSADTVARSAALLMADTSRQGQLLYSQNGEITEIEEGLLQANKDITNGATPGEDLMKYIAKLQANTANL